MGVWLNEEKETEERVAVMADTGNKGEAGLRKKVEGESKRENGAAAAPKGGWRLQPKKIEKLGLGFL